MDFISFRRSYFLVGFTRLLTQLFLVSLNMFFFYFISSPSAFFLVPVIPRPDCSWPFALAPFCLICAA